MYHSSHGQVFIILFIIYLCYYLATSLELADAVRYPTMTRVIGSAFRLGRAMKEVLTYFNWMRVALFYTDDKVCSLFQ
jgi:hypothetical protein